ncbi:hypothetical protein CPB84DRAFT_1859273 [Gymnopilus junonius]|uniref:Uncharacterized protein n=1 Tax=Gymnopilus junonius TaxID=109634 RepID=A0A9P5N6J0_GYMJU|nr:hypothetical protein CPB84DRAFT_1859273 [Gymnopilus junonius]
MSIDSQPNTSNDTKDDNDTHTANTTTNTLTPEPSKITAAPTTCSTGINTEFTGNPKSGAMLEAINVSATASTIPHPVEAAAHVITATMTTSQDPTSSIGAAAGNTHPVGLLSAPPIVVPLASAQDQSGVVPTTSAGSVGQGPPTTLAYDWALPDQDTRMGSPPPLNHYELAGASHTHDGILHGHAYGNQLNLADFNTAEDGDIIYSVSKNCPDVLAIQLNLAVTLCNLAQIT